MTFANQSLNDALAQYDNAQRQQRHWMHEELHDLRMILTAIIYQSGGVVHVSERSLDAFRHMSPDHFQINMFNDVANRCITLTVKNAWGTDNPAPEDKSCQ